MEVKKIVLIGDAEVGKSTFVKRLIDGSFVDKYTPTLGVEIYPIKRGNLCYNIWDCAGNERYRGLGDGYYINSHGAIIMCDASNLLSIQNVNKWVDDFKRLNPTQKILIVLNKSELCKEHIKENSNCVIISCFENMGLEKVLSFF